MANVQTITIPKKEYEFLVKLKEYVEADFEGRLSKKMMNSIKKSRAQYNKGKFVTARNSRERKKMFNSL
jgi:hypothetical protein